MKASRILAGVVPLCFLLLLVPAAHAQWEQLPETGSAQEMFPDNTKMAGQVGLMPSLTAQLADERANAKQRRAVVDVQVDGVQIIDPAAANYVPRLDQAHLQYRLDDGQVIDTTQQRMDFSGLAPGEHRIRAGLAGNDNRPIGHETTLKVYVP